MLYTVQHGGSGTLPHCGPLQGLCTDGLSALQAVMLSLALEQRQAFLFLKTNCALSREGTSCPRRQWWTADSRLKGGVSIAEDSISGISYFFDLQIMGKEFANFLKLNSLLHWQTENLHQIIWEFNCWRRLHGGSATFFNSYEGGKKKISVHQPAWLSNASNFKID